jgi:FkbM family methyltransferase
MNDLIPAYAVEASLPRPDPLRFSFCTLVSKPSLYRAMLESFETAGFTTADCEFLYIDNTAGNHGDGYRGLNHLISQARGTYVVLCHQDLLVIDPRSKLDACIAELTELAPDWAVIGNAGYDAGGSKRFRITDRHKFNYHVGELPGRVVTLDENFLLVRRDALLGFSHDLSGFHMYGPDLVTQAVLRGRTAWVVDFHLEHLGVGKVDASFLAASEAFQSKYRRALASRDLRTTVTVVSLGKPSLAARKRLRRLTRKSLPGGSDTVLRKALRWFRYLPYRLHELRHGPTYMLNGTRFTIPPRSPFAALKAIRKGVYEAPERRMVAKWLPRDLPVVELGGSYGIVSHHIRKHISDEQKLVILEANPQLLPICRGNVDLAGQTEKTRVLGAALAYGDDPTIRFAVSDGVHDSHIASTVDTGLVVDVPAVTLSSLLDREGIIGSYSLVCDIEGSEFDLLLHDKAALARCACMVLEFHPPPFMDRGSSVSEFLRMVTEAGFTIVDYDALVLVAMRSDGDGKSSSAAVG